MFVSRYSLPLAVSERIRRGIYLEDFYRIFFLYVLLYKRLNMTSVYIKYMQMSWLGSIKCGSIFGTFAEIWPHFRHAEIKASDNAFYYQATSTYLDAKHLLFRDRWPINSITHSSQGFLLFLLILINSVLKTLNNWKKNPVNLIQPLFLRKNYRD